jgi:hypothetical protein
MIDSMTLDNLGRSLITMIINEIAYFKYELITPGDFTNLKNILSSNVVQTCIFQNKCEEINSLYSTKYATNCKNTTSAVIGAIHYFFMDVYPEDAYEIMLHYVSDLFHFDAVIEDILLQNTTHLKCLPSAIPVINSANKDIVAQQVTKTNTLTDAYARMAKRSPLFQ